MNVRKILASTAAVAMIAGVVTLASAPAASAATIRIDISCATDPINSVTQVVAQAGDTIIVSGIDCIHGTVDSTYAFAIADFGEGPAETWSFEVAPDLALGTYGSSEDVVFGVDNDDDIAPAFCGGDFDRLCGALFYLTITDAPSAEEASPIPSWVQGYGRASADEVCLEGWDASWAQWMNAGTGGFVCQRSIPSLG